MGNQIAKLTQCGIHWYGRDSGVDIHITRMVTRHISPGMEHCSIYRNCGNYQDSVVRLKYDMNYNWYDYVRMYVKYLCYVHKSKYKCT